MNTAQTTALRVVIRFLDGRILKGTTRDFSPNKPDFHVYPDGDERAAAVKVTLPPLKAVFFVKTFEGDRDHVLDNSFRDCKVQGRRIQVTFRDGEVMAGMTAGYAPNRPGFFLIPADPGTNNERVFVVTTAVIKVEWLPMPQHALAGTSR